MAGASAITACAANVQVCSNIKLSVAHHQTDLSLIGNRLQYSPETPFHIALLRANDGYTENLYVWVSPIDGWLCAVGASVWVFRSNVTGHSGRT